MRRVRLSCGLASMALVLISFVGLLVLPQSLVLTATAVAAAAMLAGECAERLLYFASVVYDRMPGTLK